MEFKFKKKYTEEVRTKDYEELNRKHPNKYPIIFQKMPNSTLENLNKEKYLIDPELSFRQVNYFVKGKLSLEDEHKNIRFFINGKTPIKYYEIVKDVYDKNKDKDGFLYLGFDYKPKKFSINKIIFFVMIFILLILIFNIMKFLLKNSLKNKQKFSEQNTLLNNSLENQQKFSEQNTPKNNQKKRKKKKL